MNEAGRALAAALAGCPLVGILRRHPPDHAADAACAAVEAGIRVVEVTLDSPDALGQLRRLCSALGDAVVLGAGTVVRPEQVDEAAAAGAQFVVSPHLDIAVVARARELRLAAMPGAFTPGEVTAAWQAGAALVKLFPAGPAGASYLRALRGPYPDIPLVATGGISGDRVSEFLEAGATGVGLGSELFGHGSSAAGPGDIAARTRALITTIRGQT